MAARCNIPSTIEDPSYRYKMPRIVTRIEGRGNGIKTCMVNMADVARALKCPPAYPTKFLGCELGALSSFNDEEEKSIVNGAHETSTAQNLIDKFIEKFILCPNCKLPETDMTIKKGDLCAGCKACGWNGYLDNEHKLVKFIVQNPPGGGGDAGGAKKKDKKARREAKAAKQRTKDDDDEEEEDDDEDVKKKKKKDKKEKKDKKDKKEKKKDKKKKEKGSDDDSDEEGKKKKKKKDKKDKKKKDKGNESDSDDEQVKKKDSKGSKAGEDDDDDLAYDDEAIKESILRLRKLAVNDEGKLTKNVEDFFDEARIIQVQNAFSPKTRMYVVLEAMCGEDITTDKLKPRLAYIKKMASKPVMPPPDIFYGFEVYYEANPGSRKAYPMILKQLYDADIVTEVGLLSHYAATLDSPGFEEAKKAAKPFLDWLQEGSDSDSDSDSGSDSD